MIGVPIEEVKDMIVPEEKAQVSAVKIVDIMQSFPESEMLPVGTAEVLPQKTIEPSSDRPLKPQYQNHSPEQMTFPGMEDHKPGVDDIIGLLEATGTEYVDKRANGGSLWIIGGCELAETVEKAKALGCIFRFKKEGGRATKNKPGWWTK